MIWIAHRGNIKQKEPHLENHPDYLMAAIQKGYDVEVDVWLVDNNWVLGHDAPQYQVSSSFLAHNQMWLHAKNLLALARLVKEKHHCFWHQEDDVTLTSRGYLWTFPGKELMPGSISVMPEFVQYSPQELQRCAGICTDRIEYYQNFLSSK